MIKGSATIQYGSGSVASVYGIDEDTGMGAVFMATVAPGKIGRDQRRVDNDFVMNNPEVVMYFTNVESLEIQIKCLMKLRSGMINHMEKK